MLHLPEINNQLSNQDLFAAFKTQLLKDVEASNFPTDTIKNIIPDYQRIHSLINDLLQNNEFSSQRNMMHLIYRVDISEEQLAKYLSENKDRNYFDVIAELIIKRILQKVVMKQHFKNADNS